MNPIEAAKDKGYLDTTDRTLRAEWWRWCEERRWPFVHIRRRRKYAAVTLDMWPAEKELSASAEEAIRELALQYNDWHQRDSFVGYGRHHAYIPYVRAEDAEDAARALLKVALEACGE